ncbi:hypothetical protein Y600_5925 [Burkholderia pseudomallei MSHR3709]|nr:hypothetical protein Y600_5925 [Burkholderia pseudomallei MSHR3709]
MRLRDSPVTANLVPKIEPPGYAVVRFCLKTRLKLRDLRQPLRREQSPIDRESLEGELSFACFGLSLGYHVQSTFGRRTNRPMTSAGRSAFTLYRPRASAASRTRR